MSEERKNFHGETVFVDWSGRFYVKHDGIKYPVYDRTGKLMGCYKRKHINAVWPIRKKGENK